MGNLYLVRHGQASFGADDYDQLSELGVRQSVRLGQYLADKGLQFEAAYTGSLKRHTQTLDGIRAGLRTRLESVASIGTTQVWPGLNEYDTSPIAFKGCMTPISLLTPMTEITQVSGRMVSFSS